MPVKLSLKALTACIIIFILIIGLFTGSLAFSFKPRNPALVQNYAIYYGKPDSGKIKTLRKFDLVVIDPENFSKAQVQSIRQKGTIVLGYQPTLVVNNQTPGLTGLLPGDFLTVNGQRLETSRGSLLDPRSAHVRQLITAAVKDRIYTKGMDGVFLQDLNVPSETIRHMVALPDEAIEALQKKLFAATADLAGQLKAMDKSKYLGQSEGWRELKDYTGPYLNFLFWFDYPIAQDNDPWINDRRNEVLALKKTHGVVPLISRDVGAFDLSAVNSFYASARSRGLIPYASFGGYGIINAYGLPRLPHDVKSYVVVYGPLTAAQIKEMQKFDMAVVDTGITDEQLAELQSAGVIVTAYRATTSIDQRHPGYAGLEEQDYLKDAAGQKIANNSDDPPDWVMDPRSSHFRQLVIDSIKKEVFARGFDGVFLDTLNIAGEYAYSSVSPEPEIQQELLTASANLLKEVRAAEPDKIIVQNCGWRELVNLTAPYIDFLLWEDYPYQTETDNTWYDEKRENLINLKNQYNFKVLTARFFNWSDTATVQEFYDVSRSYGFIPYAPRTSGPRIYNNVNTYDVPPRSP